MLQHFRGEKTISEIGDALKAPVEKVLELAVALDRLGLLEGPTAEALEDAKLKQLREAGHFPPRSTQGRGNSEIARAAIRGWFAETEDPELTGVPVAVLAPSLSYSQAWEVFAGACTLSAADLPRTEWWCWDQPTPPSGKGFPAHNWASRPPSGFVLWTKSCSNCSKKNLAIRTTTTNWITLPNTAWSPNFLGSKNSTGTFP